MANVQIPNLPAVVGISGSELFEAVQAGTSVKVSLSQIASHFNVDTVIAFATRAEAVSWMAANTVEDGTVVMAAGFAYRKVPSSTAISDMPNWVPALDVAPDHWAQNTTPGTTDMAAAINYALLYLSGLGGGTLDGGGLTYAMSTPVYFSNKTNLKIVNFKFVPLAGWASASAMFVVNYATSTKADISFNSCYIDGSVGGVHTANGIVFTNAANCSVVGCVIVHVPDFAIRSLTKNTELIIDRCRLRQFWWGEAGFDVEANRTAKLLDLRTADFLVTNTVAAYCYMPISVTGDVGPAQVLNNHFYNGFLSSTPSFEPYVAYFDAANTIISGNYFDNGLVECDVTSGNMYYISGNLFHKNGNGDNTHGLRYTNSGASVDLDFNHLVDNHFNYAAGLAIEFSGTFSTTKTWVVSGNSTNSGIPSNVPYLHLGDGLQYDTTTGLTLRYDALLSPYSGDYTTINAERGIVFMADYNNNSGESQSSIYFGSDGIIKNRFNESGGFAFGYQQATGGASIAHFGWDPGTNQFYISPPNVGGTAQDYGKRLTYIPGTGWQVYDSLDARTTMGVRGVFYTSYNQTTGGGSGAAISIEAGTDNFYISPPNVGGTGQDFAKRLNYVPGTGWNFYGPLFPQSTFAVNDVNFVVQDDGDPTKQLKFQLSGITTGNTRTLTVPDASGTIALIDQPQTFTASQTFSAATNTFGTSTATGVQTFAGGATASGNTKTINVGTGGLAGSTTSIFIGPGAGGAGTVQFNPGVTSITMPTATISGGSINNATIGATTPAAGTFTDLAAVSTDAGSGLGPDIQLNRNSASPAAGDNLGSIRFNGRDSGAASQTYSMIYGYIGSPTAGAETGGLAIQTVNAGTLADAMIVDNNGKVSIQASFPSLYSYNDLVVGKPTNASGSMSLVGASLSTIQFTNNVSASATHSALIQFDHTLGRLSLNAAAATPLVNLFDGTSAYSGRVGIGTSTPGYLLDVNGTLNATTIRQGGTALGTMSTQNANSVAITGGTIQNTAIGGVGVAAAGYFTSLTATGGTILGTTSADALSVIASATFYNSLTIKDNDLIIQDNLDTTKVLKFNAANISPSTTRTLSAPDAGGTIALIDQPQSFTSTQTFNNIVINNSITENVYAVVDAAGVALTPNNGGIQTWTLGANRTPTSGAWSNGQSMTLMINDGTAYTITWTTLAVTWVGGSAPTLATTGYTIVVLWKVGGVIYGSLTGSA